MSWATSVNQSISRNKDTILALRTCCKKEKKARCLHLLLWPQNRTLRWVSSCPVVFSNTEYSKKGDTTSKSHTSKKKWLTSTQTVHDLPPVKNLSRTSTKKLTVAAKKSNNINKCVKFGIIYKSFKDSLVPMTCPLSNTLLAYQIHS